MSHKEINMVLQKKLVNVTNVYPKVVDEHANDANDANNANRVDIYHAVKPFYSLLVLFGMQKVSFDDEKKVVSTVTKVYASCIAVAVVCVQTFVIYQKFIDTYPSYTPASVITDLLTIIPLTLSTVASLLMAVTCNREMIQRTLNNFIVVDKQLSIQNQNVYKPLRTKIVIVVASILVATTLQYAYDYIYRPELGLEYFGRVFMFIVKELVILEIVLLIYVDITRLEATNVQLENTKYEINKLFNDEVYMKRQNIDSVMTKFTNRIGASGKEENSDEEKVDDLIRLMRVYDRLADNANIVNSCFGIPLLCSAIAVFINILSTVDKLITMSNNNDSNSGQLVVGSIISWCIRDLFFVTLVTIACERLQSRVKNTTDIINKLSISSRIDANKQELLERFSQLIACRRFILTACNFFPFDFTFIYSLVGAVATYTVILLQVSQPQTKKT